MTTWSDSDLEDLVAYFEDVLDWEFDVNDFDDRFRMQKFVYFARECGLSIPYEYNIYRYGPYSPALAKDYYELSGTGNPAAIDDTIDKDLFEELVRNRDNGWLEVAATIHKLRPKLEIISSGDTRSEVIERVSNMKEEPEEHVAEVYEELDSLL